LTREWVTTCRAVGFDPFLGFYHAHRYGRPSLALDLMEPFRPLCADSVVIRAVNNGEIGASDFIERMGAVNCQATSESDPLASRKLTPSPGHPSAAFRFLPAASAFARRPERRFSRSR